MRPRRIGVGRCALGTALAAVLALLGGLFSPAHAERIYLDDAENTSITGGDIARVQLDHAPRNVFVKVKYHPRSHWPKGKPGDRLNIFYDVNPKNPGPEFKAQILVIREALAAEAPTLRRIDDFGQGGRTRTCSGDTSQFTQAHAVFVTMPRSCLKIGGKQPKRVRISVHAANFSPGASSPDEYDWTPRKQQFGRWLDHA